MAHLLTPVVLGSSLKMRPLLSCAIVRSLEGTTAAIPLMSIVRGHDLSVVEKA